jgi:hypothetical protein
MPVIRASDFVGHRQIIDLLAHTPSTKTWELKTTETLIISIPPSRNSGSISENADDRFDSFTSPPQKSGKGHIQLISGSLDSGGNHY